MARRRRSTSLTNALPSARSPAGLARLALFFLALFALQNLLDGFAFFRVDITSSRPPLRVLPAFSPARPSSWNGMPGRS